MPGTPTSSRAAAAGGLFDAYAFVRDEKADGTAGGTSTLGSWQTRTLNAEVFDPDGIVTLAANQFTLGAGSYFIVARAPGFNVGTHMVRIQNVTDATTVGEGASCDSATGHNDHATVAGRTTIAAAKAFELQHQSESTRINDGFGTATTFAVTTEVYAEVWIYREA